MVKNLPVMQETRVWFLGWEDPLEKRVATHSSILAWRIPWTEGPGGLQSFGSHKESDTTEWLTLWLFTFYPCTGWRDPGKLSKSLKFSKPSPQMPPVWCSVTKSCPTLCNPMDCSMTGSSILHYLPEFSQIHVQCVADAIQPSHPLPPPSPLALSLSQYQDFFQWVSSWHQVARVLECQLQQ